MEDTTWGSFPQKRMDLTWWCSLASCNVMRGYGKGGGWRTHGLKLPRDGWLVGANSLGSWSLHLSNPFAALALGGAMS